jgi:hypothetical protein
LYYKRCPVYGSLHWQSLYKAVVGLFYDVAANGKDDGEYFR